LNVSTEEIHHYQPEGLCEKEFNPYDILGISLQKYSLTSKVYGLVLYAPKICIYVHTISNLVIIGT
jgi:hypothetical protein